MNKIDELKKIKKLFDEGLLSEKEYSSLKAEIIGKSEPEPTKTKNEEPTANTDDEQHIDSTTQTTDKSHFSKKGMILFLGIIAALVIFYQLHDKGLISVNGARKSYDSSHLKNWADLEGYITQEVEWYCNDWHKLQTYQNEDNKVKEWLFLDGSTVNFEMSVIPAVLQNNDLPRDWWEKASKIFNEKLGNCGYYQHGGMPPTTQSGISNANSNTNSNSNNVFSESSPKSLSEQAELATAKDISLMLEFLGDSYWTSDCENAFGNVRYIKDENYIQLDVAGNQIYIYARYELHDMYPNRLLLYATRNGNGDIMGDFNVGASELPWKDFDFAKPIAQLIFDFQVKDEFKVQWFGFYNSRKNEYNKGLLEYPDFMHNGNDTLKKCQSANNSDLKTNANVTADKISTSNASLTNELIPFRNIGRASSWGYKNKTGEIVCKPIYSWTSKFFQDKAFVFLKRDDDSNMPGDLCVINQTFNVIKHLDKSLSDISSMKELPNGFLKLGLRNGEKVLVNRNGDIVKHD